MTNPEPNAQGGKRLQSKRILVTGSASGQGAAVQQAFCENGARVAGCDRTEGGAEREAGRLSALGFEAHGRHADLSDPAAAKAWVDWAAETLGGIDVVYSNAAATEFAPFGEMTRELWDFSIKNELNVVFDVAHAAWPHLTRSAGSIINLGSVSALVADATLGQTAHMAAKAGMIAFTQQLASEGGPHGVRANVSVRSDPP